MNQEAASRIYLITFMILSLILSDLNCLYQYSLVPDKSHGWLVEGMMVNTMVKSGSGCGQWSWKWLLRNQAHQSQQPTNMNKSALCWSIQEQGHQKFAPETIEFPLSKNQTKWPIELWTLKREMETDDDHATITESFSLVKNIRFIEYTDIFLAHL